MASQSDALALSHIARSNIPAQDKSFVMRIANRVGLTGASATMARAKRHAIAAGQAVRGGGEAAIVGSALAAASVYLPTGLDLEINTTNNGQKTLRASMPIDAIIGAAGLGASVLLAHEEVSTDLRNAGLTAVGVFSYRKTQDFLAEKVLANNQKAGAVQRTPGFTVHKADTNFAKLQAANAAQQKTGSTAGEFGHDFGEDPIARVARNMT